MKYLKFQSIVNYRIPISDDGTVGKPEITNKFTKEFGIEKVKKKQVQQLTIGERKEKIL